LQQQLSHTILYSYSLVPFLRRLDLAKLVPIVYIFSYLSFSSLYLLFLKEHLPIALIYSPIGKNYRHYYIDWICFY